MRPQRIQRKRTKGWRMPENTVYVGRGSRWGNPFIAGSFYETRTSFHDCPVPFVDRQTPFFMHEGWGLGDRIVPIYCNPVRDREQAVELFRRYVEYNDDVWTAEAYRLIRGKNLACWCPLDQPCHADVLLDLANGAGK